jgi:S1-C subfamily serine protease
MRLQLQLQNRSGACEKLKQTQGICMKFSLLLLPGLAIAAPFGSTAEHPIDDAKIFQRLDREVGALAESGKAPLGREERLKQVARRTTTVPKLLPASSNILSKEDLYTRAAASTVLFGTAFKCDKCTRWHSAMASGVIIDPSGIVVTNYHVAGAAKGDAMGVMLSDGTFLAVTEILAADQKQDVAIVRIQTGGKALPALPVRTDLRAGGDILCMSNPDNCAGYLSEGIVARYNRESRPGGNGPVWMQITADFAKGSSGGPILDRSGNVVGIVSSTSSVYYDEPKNGGQPNNLQMVRHNCVPSTAILGLTQEAKPAGR